MATKSSGLYNIIDESGINKSIMSVISSGVHFNTYTTPKGIKELRIEISRLLNSLWGCEINYQNMLITSGSQQSINLMVYSLLKDGDTVLIEQPTYYGAVDVFKKRSVSVVGVKLQDNGIDLEDLETKIKEHNPKLIYVTPTFNNPTGDAWDIGSRLKFLEIINKYNVLVIEDDPYSLINYTDEEYPSLYKLNNGKNIFYLGTFSKYISPSITVGYILSSSEYLETIYSFKESFDLCSSLFSQLVVLDYLKNNDLVKVVKDKVPVYKTLLDKSKSELIEKFGNDIELFSNIKGGIFFTVKFKSAITDPEFLASNHFYIEGSHNNETRINICSYDK